jgi:hypothetical protein
MNTEIPTTAFNQFGGNRAMSMIGGRPLATDEFTLRIKWAAKAANGARLLTIRLDPCDTYTLTFLTLGGKVITTLADIYAEDLRRVFEMHTGLYLSL